MARIAIVQDDCILGEKALNIEKAAGLIKSAAEQNAALVLFPEMYLTGYALGDNIHQLAEAVSGPGHGKSGLSGVSQSHRARKGSCLLREQWSGGPDGTDSGQGGHDRSGPVNC